MAMIACKIVEVCVFKMVRRKPLFLLLHRAKDEKIYPDIWQFISGSIESNEKAADAATRELSEETGLSPKSFWVVPFINSFYDPGWDAVNLSPLFAAEVDKDSTPQLSAEHCEFGWYAYDEAMKMLVWPGQREGMRIVKEYILTHEKASELTRIR